MRNFIATTLTALSAVTLSASFATAEINPEFLEELETNVEEFVEKYYTGLPNAPVQPCDTLCKVSKKTEKSLDWIEKKAVTSYSWTTEKAEEIPYWVSTTTNKTVDWIVEDSLDWTEEKVSTGYDWTTDKAEEGFVWVKSFLE